MTLLLIFLAAATSLDGYERAKSATLDLAKVAPTSFTGKRGECFVFVLTPEAGAKLKSEVIDEVTVEVKEPTVTYTLDPKLKPEGGRTRSYCLVKGGKVTVHPYNSSPANPRNVALGKGKLTLEVWKKSLSSDELVQLDEKQRAQKQREKNLAQGIGDPEDCAACRQSLARCQAGDAPTVWKAMRYTCMQGFNDCVAGTGWKPSRCGP